MQAIKVLPVILISLLLVGGFLLVAETSAAPGATIIVDTLEDNTNDDGYCSLREAITAANTNTIVDACPAGELAAIDTISFSVSGTITLVSSSLPDILAAGGPLAGRNRCRTEGRPRPSARARDRPHGDLRRSRRRGRPAIPLQ